MRVHGVRRKSGQGAGGGGRGGERVGPGRKGCLGRLCGYRWKVSGVAPAGAGSVGGDVKRGKGCKDGRALEL